VIAQKNLNKNLDFIYSFLRRLLKLWWLYDKEKINERIAVNGYSHLTATGRHLSYGDHTVLPATKFCNVISNGHILIYSSSAFTRNYPLLTARYNTTYQSSFLYSYTRLVNLQIYYIILCNLFSPHSLNLESCRFRNRFMVNIDLSHQKYSTYHSIWYASNKNGKIA